MMGAHVVEALCFEIDFGSEEEAFEAQERLMRFAQGRAQQVISDVFDDAVASDVVLRLDKLEVDVGTIAAVDFEDRFAERLREALQRVLGERRELVSETLGVGPSNGAEEPVRPYTELMVVSLAAKSGMFVWPRMMAPAARSLATTGASAGATSSFPRMT